MDSKDYKLFPRKVAVVIFYDKKLNVLVQKRRSHSKVGEQYGFFGGGIEKNETVEDGLRRELVEELNYNPKKLAYWGKYSFTIDLPNSKFNDEVRFGELYFSPITRELIDTHAEGDTEKVLLPLDRILENRNQEFGPVKFNDIVKIKEDLIKLINTSASEDNR